MVVVSRDETANPGALQALGWTDSRPAALRHGSLQVSFQQTTAQNVVLAVVVIRPQESRRPIGSRH